LGYSSVFNILDYSSVMLLVGKVEEADTWESSPRGKGFGGKDERFAAYNKEGEKAPRK
jgi:hypothetical protein